MRKYNSSCADVDHLIWCWKSIVNKESQFDFDLMTSATLECFEAIRKRFWTKEGKPRATKNKPVAEVRKVLEKYKGGK